MIVWFNWPNDSYSSHDEASMEAPWDLISFVQFLFPRLFSHFSHLISGHRGDRNVLSAIVSRNVLWQARQRRVDGWESKYTTWRGVALHRCDISERDKGREREGRRGEEGESKREQAASPWRKVSTAAAAISIYLTVFEICTYLDVSARWADNITYRAILLWTGSDLWSRDAPRRDRAREWKFHRGNTHRAVSCKKY